MPVVVVSVCEQRYRKCLDIQKETHQTFRVVTSWNIDRGQNFFFYFMNCCVVCISYEQHYCICHLKTQLEKKLTKF